MTLNKLLNISGLNEPEEAEWLAGWAVNIFVLIPATLNDISS